MRSTTSALLGASFLVTAAIVACGSDGAPGGAGPAGAAGATGASGDKGAPGANGANGAAGPGVDAGGDSGINTLFLSEVAKHGLDISPVVPNLAGKTPAEIDQIGTGSYLVNAIAACTDCHTSNPAKFLAGGVPFPMPIPNGMVQSRNLTPDAVTGLKQTEGQFLENMRQGADFLNSGQGLIVHPWQSERWTAVSDLKAIYAYLRAIPAVSNQIPADVKPPVTQSAFPANYNEGQTPRALPPDTDFFGVPVPDPDHVLRGLAIFPLNVAEPPDAANAALFGRGSYIVNGPAACGACHSNPERNFASPNLTVNAAQYLAGGTVFPIDPSLQPVFKIVRAMTANLTGATHGFFAQPGMTFQTFLITITQGVAGDEPPPRRALAPIMPAHIYRNMTLGDLQAVYTYMRWVATTAPRTGADDKPTQSPARYCTQLSDCTGAGESCNMTTHECVGKTCAIDKDCDACQTCSTTCIAPSPSSTCLTLGL
jgi:hypothetical protein